MSHEPPAPDPDAPEPAQTPSHSATGAEQDGTQPRPTAPVPRGSVVIVEAVALGHGPDAVTHIVEVCSRPLVDHASDGPTTDGPTRDEPSGDGATGAESPLAEPGASEIEDSPNYVILVAGLLPTERARVEVTSAARKHGRGRVLEQLSTSPGRVDPQCPHIANCRRCDRQHIDESMQRELAQESIRESLPRMLGKESVPIGDLLAPTTGYGQRTSLYTHVRGVRGDLSLGFLRRGGEEFTPIDQCPVHHPKALALATAVLRAAEAERLPAWDPESDSGLLRGIHVRISASGGGNSSPRRDSGAVDPRFADFHVESTRRTGGAHVTFVLRRDSLRDPGPLTEAAMAAGASGVTMCINEGPPGRPFGRQFDHLAGERVVLDELGGISFRISADGWFPPTAFGAHALHDAVRRLSRATRKDTVVDVYCGSGALGIALADRVGNVIGIDESRSSIDDARRTAREHRLRNAAFREGFVPRLVGQLADEGVRAGTAIVWAPGDGAGEPLLKKIGRNLGARQILYIAPSLQVLADETKFLERGPYTLDRVEPIDLTPQRHDVQAIASFSRKPN